MSKTTSRHEALLLFLSNRGYATIEDLAVHFDVTAQTIRKDINTLAKMGKLLRFHGGAGFPSGNVHSTGDARSGSRHDVTSRIAALVADHIPDGVSVCIDSGPIQEATARALLKHKRLHIVTNSLRVAEICAGNTGFEIWVAGGGVRHCDGGVFGAGVENFIRDFRVDYGILGISGIDEAGNLLEQDFLQAAVAKAIIDCSRVLFLVADASRFGKAAVARVAHLSNMTALFSDSPLTQPWDTLIRESGILLYLT